VHEGEGARWTCWGAALTKKQVLRACGAQDDMLARLRWPSPPVPSSTMWRGGTKGHHFFPFFSFGATRRCHPERARGCARAKDLLVVASRMRGNARAKDLLLRNLSDGSPRAARARAKDLLVVSSPTSDYTESPGRIARFGYPAWGLTSVPHHWELACSSLGEPACVRMGYPRVAHTLSGVGALEDRHRAAAGRQSPSDLSLDPDGPARS